MRATCLPIPPPRQKLSVVYHFRPQRDKKCDIILRKMKQLETGLLILSIFYFLFQAFRRLREDYPREDIVKASLLGGVVGGGLWWLTKSIDLGYLPILLSIVLVVFLFSRYRSWRFWHVVEIIIVPGLISLIVFWPYRLESIPLLVTLISNLLWRNYRRFHWYPSGRVGFLFLADLAILSLLNSILDFYQGRLIKLGVQITILLISLIGIVLLSGVKRETRIEVNKK